MIFLFDVDGVCGDLVSKLLFDIHKEFKTEVPKYEDISAHGKLLDSKETMLNSEQLEFAQALMSSEGYANNFKVIDDCKVVIDLLRKQGHTVKWLTAPYYKSKTWCYDRLQWLKNNFAATDNDVIFAQDKSLIYGDVFIDDKESNIEAWQHQWKNGAGLLFSQPWNVKSNLPRITWSGIMKLGQ